MLSNYLLGGSKGDGPELFKLCSNFTKKRFREGPKHKTLGVLRPSFLPLDHLKTTPFQFAQLTIFVNSFQHHFTSLSTTYYLEIAPND